MNNGNMNREFLIYATVINTLVSLFTSNINYWIISIINFIKAKFVYTITINSNEIDYCESMIEMFYNMKSINNKKILVKTTKSIMNYLTEFNYTIKTYDINEYETFEEGDYIYYYKGKLINIKVSNELNKNNKILKIMIYLGDKKFYNELVKEVKSKYNTNKKDKLEIFRYSKESFSSRGWTIYLQNIKLFDNIILDKKLKDSLIEDIEWYLGNKKWYTDKGIHYHRGYLFGGPPGTGKSSTIQAIASKYGMPIYTINIDQVSVDKFTHIKKRSIIVFEDIDRYLIVNCNNNKKKNNDKNNKDNKDNETLNYMMGIFGNNTKIENNDIFKNLLQILDGMDTPEDVIFIMTANNPVDINPSLMRCGRIDKKFNFGFCTPYQAEMLFLKFFNDEKDLAKKFREEYINIFGNQVTPADIQERLLQAISKDNVLECFTKKEEVVFDIIKEDEVVNKVNKSISDSDSGSGSDNEESKSKETNDFNKK